MDAERLRAYLLTLPHAVETMQWGENLVFWVGDKAIGGKMFAFLNLDGPPKSNPAAGRRHHLIVSYPAGPARYSELVEVEGIYPAPYTARLSWVAAERWDVFSPAEWRAELTRAHALTLAKLPPKTRRVLDMPAAAQKRLIAERRLAVEKAKLTKSARPAGKSRGGGPGTEAKGGSTASRKAPSSR